uniref:Dynamin N-terminal domain-containing protein n=1 Tax=Amphimedon queenslandica TaxID=400682 RepID=A0A1X7U834_AMPQE
MAERPDPSTEQIGLLDEAEEDENWDIVVPPLSPFAGHETRGIISSAEYADDAPLSDSDNKIKVSEVFEHHPEDNNASNDNPGYFTRVSTGNVNMASSGYSIIKSITEGAQHIGHKLIQAYYQDDTAILHRSITKTCQLILNIVRKYNGQNNILVQKEWLNETEYLLQNKVLTVGVFGRHNAGKSTLLNALLYHEVLSVADTNETAFVLRIYHKPRNHHGSSCFENTEQSLSMKDQETEGHRSIRKTIKRKNSGIREKGATIDVDELEAHVPFLCRCSTGDINIVLLDTPGLSESNELGISEVSEHQLMTCAVYVYVISSQQLEDSIDTDSLRAIVKRDPNAFAERRIIIAVTRLDQYSTTTSEDESSDPDSESDDESKPAKDDEEEIIKRIHSIKEVIQRQCKCLGVPIPDDCIIPLHATGALEARKKMINLRVKKKEPDQESKLSTANERDKISQVPLLEEKLIEIATNSHYLWHYNIVRDCTKYCDQAMEKLDGSKKEFIKHERGLN